MREILFRGKRIDADRWIFDDKFKEYKRLMEDNLNEK